jgi:integrase
MRLVQVHNKTLLLSNDGAIHAPYSLFLNDKFDNPHTRESSASGLRLLESFLHAHSISLPHRAQEGLCLLPSEIQSLTELAYRPVNEVELMSKVMIKHISKASKDHSSKNLKGAVESNTAGRRLDQIAAFLTWYLETVLDYRIRSSSQRQELRQRYNQTTDGLKARIRGGKKNHPNEIRSLPEEVFLKIVKNIFLRPESIIQSASGKPSATMMRDRAIALLACEGLRPGAIGSLTLNNFRWRAGDVAGGYMDISDNVAKRKTRTTTKTPVQKGIGSTTQSYNSDGTIKLWPWTCHAIKDYIDGERASLTGKTLANKTKGFLFIADHGGPIGDRTTLSAAFSRLKKGLRSKGLLNKSESDQYQKDAYYEFTAYTLRHSSASLFHDRKRHEKDVEDQMRMRFGWSAKSTMPSHYARRSISNRANVDLMNFYESLVEEMKRPKENA